jgi:hypothetical protein
MIRELAGDYKKDAVLAQTLNRGGDISSQRKEEGQVRKRMVKSAKQ